MGASVEADRDVSRILFALCALAISAPAFAADMPVKAPPQAVVQQSGGFYLWVDGSYQSINLPTYDLGMRLSGPGIAFIAGGIAETHDPRATGYGIKSAIGFIFPHGTFWGSNARIEIGGSYVNADGTQSGVGPTNPNFIVQGLAGLRFGINCTPTCQTSSTLASDYAGWQVWGKTASDFKFGMMTVTPSVAVFGGATRNRQNFSQQAVDTAPPFASYAASSDLDWTDWGVRLGLDVTAELGAGFAVGLGGSVGTARREASLSATDQFFTGATVFSSAIAADKSVTPFLANAEASLIFRRDSTVTVRAFAGLNYDNRVPGISAPTFTGPTGLPTSITPASIKFESETSWYVGGGVTVKFAP
jgi:hypothetical protein